MLQFNRHFNKNTTDIHHADISGTEELSRCVLCGVSEHASLTLELIQRWPG